VTKHFTGAIASSVKAAMALLWPKSAKTKEMLIRKIAEDI
jgi:hypothetical protein